MHITAIISNNGLGHFKRMTGLLDALLERLPNLELDIVCEAWQIDLTSDWAKTQRVYEHPKCTIHPELLKNAPRSVCLL